MRLFKFTTLGILFYTLLLSGSLYAGYQEALDAYYLGQYDAAKEELEGVSHPNRALLLSLIQLKTNDSKAAETFADAQVPAIGRFEKVLRVWFSNTSNMTEMVESRQALGTSGNPEFVEVANLELAKAYYAKQQYREARAISVKLASAKQAFVRKDALLIRIDIAIVHGDKQDTESLYRQFLTQFPTSDTGFSRLIALNKRFSTGYGALDILGNRSSQMAYIRGLYSRKSYYDFKVMTAEFLRRYPNGQEAQELKKGLGVVAFDTGDYPTAVTIMTDFISEYPNSEFVSTAQYYLARGLHRQKRYREAKEQYDFFLTKYPKSDFVPAVYYYIYWTCDELGTTDEFGPYLKQFKSQYSTNVFYDKLMWEFGWKAYLRQDYETAFDILGRSDWKFEPGVAAKVSYWMAKAMDQTNPERSRSLFQKLLEDHPFTYYGYRVATQLFPSYVGGLSSRFKSTGMQIDPLYRTMLDSGLGDMAVADLDYRVNRLKDHNSKTVVTMAYLYSGMLQNHRAIGLLTSLGFAINPKDPRISREIAQLLYPRPYWDVILKYSKQYNMDPYLVVALMREESLFNPNARSRTGAMGLMQIMPSTGQGIAKGLKVTWNGPDGLRNPHTNIRFGIYYLSGLQKRFDNNPILMLSGYNAGPNATGKWLTRHADAGHTDMEVFVANIPYSETHFYVTRVLKSYWIYRLLYDPDFKDKN